MSQVRGRTGSPIRKDQARRPDGKFLKRRAFEKRLLPEPPTLKQPKAYILGRSPLRAFYYTKSARGRRGNNSRRAVEGMKWNYYLCSGKAIPKGTRPESFRAPPAVTGILSSMRAARESHYNAQHISLHEHHNPAAKTVDVPQHTMHFHHSSGTGWVDVPMPGMQTQYQQGSFVQLVEAPRQHTRKPEQIPVPVASVSLERLPSAAPSGQQIIKTTSPQAASLQSPAEVIKGTRTEVQETGALEMPAPEHTPEETKTDSPAEITIIKSKPARLHFARESIAKPGRQKTEEAVPASSKRVSSKERFKAEKPRNEGILLAPETAVQDSAPPADYSAAPIRIEDIRLPEHIGYIPSIRKKERQLKVAQGSEAVPPQ